jgi:predicted dinucleotide-binding enzyme
MKTKIGILGSGTVGQTLANGFIANNIQVKIGARTTSKLVEWQQQAGKNGSSGSFEEAATFSDTIILAVKGTIAMDVLESIGAEKLKGKTIIDATNPIADEAPINGVLKFFTSLDSSLMEELQTAFPESNFVKAFNSVGSAFMVNPQFESKPTMFICGNNETAKKDVVEIIELFGWEAEDMGAVEAARAIEPLCMLWCIPGFKDNKWSHAFKLLKL